MINNSKSVYISLSFLFIFIFGVSHHVTVAQEGMLYIYLNSIIITLYYNDTFNVITTMSTEDSLQWISKFYGIGWPYGNCTSLPSNSSYSITCDDEGHTTALAFELTSTLDHGPPNSSLTSFYLPYLYSFRVTGEGNFQLPYPSNIMEKFNNLTRFEFFYYLGSNVIDTIPDELFINNPNFSYFYCGFCGFLKKANFYLSTGMFLKIYYTYAKLNSTSFGAIEYPSLTELAISTCEDADLSINISITDAQFPKLSKFEYQSITNLETTLNLSSNLTSAIVYGINSNINVNLNCPLLTDLAFEMTNSSVVFVKPLNQSTPNLKSIYTYGFTSNYPSFEGLKKLESVRDRCGYLTSIPPIPSSIQSLFYDRCPLTGFPSVFLNESAQYGSFIFQNNPSLSGKVPQTFCNVNTFDLTLTNISDIPDCMKCYYDDILYLLPEDFPEPEVNTTTCQSNFQVYPSNYVSLDGTTITIKGQGLGWGNNNTLVSTKGNSETIFHIPTPYLSGSTEVVFSAANGLSTNVTWVSAGININSVYYDQVPEGQVVILMSGNINPSLNHSIQIETPRHTVITYPVVVINDRMFETTVDQNELQLVSSSMIISNSYNIYVKSSTYYPQFPNITSISNATIYEGSSIEINGLFGYYHKTARVLLNGVSGLCRVTSTNETCVVCQLIKTTPPGEFKLQVNVAGFTSQDYTIVVEQDTYCKRLNYCNYHGNCNTESGECVCFLEYGGADCNICLDEEICNMDASEMNSVEYPKENKSWEYILGSMIGIVVVAVLAMAIQVYRINNKNRRSYEKLRFAINDDRFLN